MPHINRRTLRISLNWLRHIKVWQLVLLLIVSIFISTSFLRMNSLRMDRLRAEVQAADKEGDKEKIKNSLIALQNYVSSHMNASLGGGVYLTESYARDREAALAAASNDTNPNAAVYQQASVECQSRFQGGVASFRNDYVTCVEERVRALGVAQDPSDRLKSLRKEDYHYNFASPIWSLDLAGLSVAVSLLITSVIFISVITELIIRILLKHHYKTV